MKNNRKLNRRKQIKIIFFIFFLSLIPLLWFKSDSLILRGDLSIPLNPINDFNQLLTVWNSQISTGGEVLIIPLFPYISFFAFFKFLGLNIITIEKIWLFFLQVLGGFSIYFLISTLTKHKKHYVTSFVAITFYLFNGIIINWHGFLTFSLALYYYCMPVLLGLFIRGFDERSPPLKSAMYLSIASLLVISSFYNFPYLGLVFFLYLVYRIIIDRRKILKYIPFLCYAIVLVLLINSWWLIPSLELLIGSGEKIAISKTTEVGNVPHFSRNATFSNIFRLTGYHWAWDAGAGGGRWVGDEWIGKGSPYYEYAFHYWSNPYLLILTFIPTILAFAALIFARKNKNVIYFAILAIIILFLSHGVNKPFGFFYEFLYKNLPGFWIFRESTKFMSIIPMIYAFMIGTSVSIIYTKLEKIGENDKIYSKVISKTFVILVICSSFIVSWPLITGTVIQSDRGFLPSHRVLIPEYWYEASDWINEQDGDFRVLLLPTGVTYIKYEWGYQGSRCIAPGLIEKPVVRLKSLGYFKTPSDQLLQDFLSSLENGNATVEPLLLMNIKYIIQRNDVEMNFNHSDTVDKLNALEAVHLEKTFGKLFIYEVEKPSYHIYPTFNVIIKDESERNLANVSWSEFDYNNSCLIFDKQSNLKSQPLINFSETSTEIKLNFQKFNPTKYEVNIETESPFILIFSETFDKGWKAYVNNINDGTSWFETLYQKPVSDGNHFIVNGYANAWYIDKIGKYKITLYFWPQSLFYIGAIVSITTFVACVTYLIYDRRRKKHQSN